MINKNRSRSKSKTENWVFFTFTSRVYKAKENLQTKQRQKVKPCTVQ